MAVSLTQRWNHEPLSTASSRGIQQIVLYSYNRCRGATAMGDSMASSSPSPSHAWTILVGWLPSGTNLRFK